ncbi:MAG TPA: single-stranded DNA-binding protein [Chitinophagaceae bacterium]|nr:single-stranded DNA-binding protein [Chitinophagaceae bacterium]
MRGMNRVILVGNAGGEPIVRVLTDGVEVARVSIASTDIFRRKDGSQAADTQWHTVIFWRGLAGLVNRYVRKGSQLLVEGRIRYRKYEDKEGASRYVTEILADRLLLLDRNLSGESDGDHALSAEDLPL